ncbi:cobalt-zinc-cadmium resistance protein CzcB [mine drainage metagenome]|uniref:Cobalt-zinc-cadmium resistance protein CzcB n=1 Tax=mine drainage metagenome TaxID=410659 RepID=A0A1J5QI79_9ZZZZ
MKRIGMLLLTLSFAAHAGNEPSVLVKTEQIQRKILSIELTGYGSVIPGAGGETSINFTHAGQVMRVDVTSGQTVKKGQVLFDLATDPSAVRAFEQAKSELDFSIHELARVKSLFEQQLATNSQYDAASKALKEAESAYAAQQKLGTGVSRDEIRAPFDGVVSQVSVVQGARILAEMPALQLIRKDTMRVQMGIEPEDSTKVKPGMPVRLASILDESQQVGGVVEEIHGIIDPQTQLVDVAVRIARGDRAKLLPGMRMRGVILTYSEKVWAVPRSAVLRDDRGAYIYQNDKGHARKVNINPGLESGGWVGISGKFDANLPVVVLGNYELHNGVTLREERQ